MNNYDAFVDDRLQIINELTALAGRFHERGDTQCAAEMLAILDARIDLVAGPG